MLGLLGLRLGVQQAARPLPQLCSSRLKTSYFSRSVRAGVISWVRVTMSVWLQRCYVVIAGQAAIKFEGATVDATVAQVMAVLRDIHEPQGISVPDPIQVIISAVAEGGRLHICGDVDGGALQI